MEGNGANWKESAEREKERKEWLIWAINIISKRNIIFPAAWKRSIFTKIFLRCEKRLK